jgi:CheY-like chemotaxis protein
MNGVIGMTALLLETRMDPVQREYAETVRDCANSLLTIINDILDFSKIEARKLQLENVDFSLRDDLWQALQPLTMRAHEKALEIVCHVAPAVPDCLVGDPTRLRQVVTNLIGNAIKFTEQGEIVMHVAHAEPAEDGVMLHFAISDTGIGIPAEKIKTIFEPFTQADGSTTRKYGGTGLGLTISSQLVALMGGRMWAESTPGKGSTFHFTLRCGIGTERASASTVSLESLQGLRVLVVDDNATNRRILEDMLCHWGMRPFLVESGAAALNILEDTAKRGESFPLVLLDGQMPEMDGFTLAQRLRCLPHVAGATVMMLSSSGRHNDRARCDALGLSAYLVKPVKPAELLATIQRVLSAARKESRSQSMIHLPAVGETRVLRILLAEDNLVNQRLAVRLLESRGHRVEPAANGREALAALERERFDLVLMDLQMPSMGGLEATAAIRSRERNGRGYSEKNPGRMPIIALTAHAMSGDRDRCFEVGMDGYLTKPMQRGELFAEIDRVIAASGAAMASESENADDPPGPVENPLLSIVEGDQELLGELIHLFRQECPRHLREIHEAIAASDATRLARAAHALKGSIGVFGGSVALELASETERLARSGSIEEAARVVRDLEQAILRLTAELDRHEVSATT